MSPLALFLLCSLGASYAEEDSSARLVFGFLAILGGCAGLLVAALYQSWLLRHIDPDRELKSKVLSLGWIRPFGALWAVRELLDESVLQGGEKPI